MSELISNEAPLPHGILQGLRGESCRRVHPSQAHPCRPPLEADASCGVRTLFN